MMLNAINNKKIPFKTVLMDSWYATQRLMGLIDNSGKIYYCPLKPTFRTTELYYKRLQENIYLIYV